MCVVKLSVLEACHHELATIDYCRNTVSLWDDLEVPPEPGVEVTLRRPCTISLGWTVYQSLDEPVTCKTCKAWLAKKGKQTYGDAMAEIEGLIKKFLGDDKIDKQTHEVAIAEIEELVEKFLVDGKIGKSVSDILPNGPPKRAPPKVIHTSKGPALPGSPAARRGMGR